MIGFGDEINRITLAADIGMTEAFEMNPAGGARRTDCHPFHSLYRIHSAENYFSSRDRASGHVQDMHKRREKIEREPEIGGRRRGERSLAPCSYAVSSYFKLVLCA